MPRFLGRDYYNDEVLVRRELCARALLIVPRRFQDDNDDDLAASCSGVYGTYQQNLQELLRPFQHTDDAEGFLWKVSDERRPEHLQWVTKWKEFDGNYIEIVPSSNPESESSIFDSQPDSVSEACEVEEFKPLPLDWNSKGDGYLEEPIHVKHSEVLTTSLPNLLKWSAAELDPPVQKLTAVVHLQDTESLSEDVLFGKDDLCLEISSGPGNTPDPASSEIPSKTEEFELHSFPPNKAEEWMCPVTYDDDLPSLSQQPTPDPYSLVREARAVFAHDEDLQASPPPPPYVQLDKGAEEWSFKELVRVQNIKNEHVEKLIAPDVSVECQTDFLSLNEHALGKAFCVKSDGAELESPLPVSNLSSPLHFENGVGQTLLQPWSPDILNSHSPLLSTEGESTMQMKLRYGEACFANIRSVKFLEPQLCIPDELLEDKPNPVASAMQLVSSAANKASIGQVELNLDWDIIPPKARQFSHCSLESLILVPESRSKHSTAWKLPTDWETFESMVDGEMEKRTLQDTAENTSEAQPVEIENAKDKIKSHKEGTTQNDLKSENMADRLSSNAEKQTGKHSKNDTYSSSSPLQSLKSSMLDKPKSNFHATTKTSWGKGVTDRQNGKGQTKVPTPNSGKNLDILDTTSTLPANFQGAKDLTKKPFSPRVDCGKGNEKRTEDACSRQQDTCSMGQENGVPTGFDLQFDDEDLDLGSDSFDDISPPAKKQAKTEPRAEEPILSEGLAAAVDPVDNFFMMRHATSAATRTRALLKGHSVVKPVDAQKRAPGVITPMSVLPKSAGDNEQRFITVGLTGPYLSALQEICSLAEPRVDRLRTQGVVSEDAKFLALQPDYTRFLLKDRMTTMSTAESQEDGKDELYEAVAMVHTLRLAAHLLMHCCLESAIIHLAAMQEKHAVLTGGLEGLRKALFQCQFTAQQGGQLHPKVAAVCREIQQHKQCHPSPHRVVVLVRREQPTLLKTLKSVVSVDGTATRIWTPQDPSSCQMDWPEDCECMLTTWTQQSTMSTLVTQSSLVLEFEADPRSSALHKACQTHNVSYVGLSVQDTRVAVPERRIPSADTGVSVVGSQRLIQHQQLLQLLETRHNIIVVRRDFASLGKTHYPDVVVDLNRGAVLVDIKELKGKGGLERTTERLAAMGLQLSTVWVLLHSIGDSSRNVFDKDALKKMVQLQALMANLSSSAKGFTATYKVLLCRSAADVALCLSHLTSLGTSSASANTDHEPCGQVPPVDMSKEEKFLLGIPCLNPFSCQLLLTRATVGEILTMSLEQLRSLVPELPESCVQNLHRVVNMDRGLQLRPHITDMNYPSETYPISVSKQLHPYHSTKQKDQNGEKVDCVPPDQYEPLLANQFDDLTQTGSSPYTHQGYGKPDHTSPPGIVPMSLSKSLHYSNQPTPFLMPNQGAAKKDDAFQSNLANRNDGGVNGATFCSPRELVGTGFGEQRQSLSEGGFRQPNPVNYPDYIQEKLRSQTGRPTNSNSVCGSQEYRLSDFQSSKNSQGYPGVSALPASRQQMPFRTDFLNHDGEKGLFSYYGHPLASEAPNNANISSSLAKQFASPRSVGSTTTYATAQGDREDGFLDEQRQFAITSSSNSFERLAALSGNDTIHGVGRPLLSSHSNSSDSNRFHPFYRDSEVASNQYPRNELPYAETSMSVPAELHRTNPQRSDSSFWSNTRFTNNNEMLRGAGMTFNDRFHPPSETLPLRAPSLSPSWKTNVYNDWNPLSVEARFDHPAVPNSTFSTEYTSNFPAGPSRSQTLPGECADFYDKEETTYFKRSTPDLFASFTDDYRRPSAEQSAAFNRDEGPRQVLATGAPPRLAQPSFSEDLAATTRWLLQGKSPGHVFGNSLHHKSRGPQPHRISVGLAQPLRREESSSQENGKAKDQVYEYCSPKVCSQQSLSPPLDMDWESSAREGNYQITDAKLKKWSAQLHCDQKLESGSRPRTFSEEDACPIAEKRRALNNNRKLTYQPVPGAGGQTKLAFL